MDDECDSLTSTTLRLTAFDGNKVKLEVETWTLFDVFFFFAYVVTLFRLPDHYG
jgi:hypothetical protein